MSSSLSLELKDFTFSELFHSDGLHRLDLSFLNFLKNKDAELYNDLLLYRAQKADKTPIDISELLIRCSLILEEFLASLFGIEEPLAISRELTTSQNPISVFKKYFVLRRAKKEIHRINNFPSFPELNAWLTDELSKAPLQSNDRELAVALLATQYLRQPEHFSNEIEKLVQWSALALASQAGQETVLNWISFQIPERLDYQRLIPTILVEDDPLQRIAYPHEKLRLRDGFKLTDQRMAAREVQNEVNYCIYCHDHDGDFCSKGFPVKKSDPASAFKKNLLDITLTGCPLEEKISEMNILKKDGATLASLAMVMIDNPMCPATGHRICNDCMKACIYQKQEPVNIPQIETRVLTDVLALPWGVEIYDLLTRWNPLRQTQWVMQPYNGLKIMIAGMGPAGFTLAHHLTMEGCAIVGFDGLKIEPLPEKYLKAPIHCFADIKEELDERLMAGFGGVAEYGITARWDKNFLKLIYLSLTRRPYFQVFGGVRFGGTITVEDAWEMGFDHFVVAVGAGLPKALPISGSMAPGMRQANDFLMALQLGNAAKAGSLTNLQIRLPAVVIGGGLTGVDTATELQAYYIAQVEKILLRYEKLLSEYGEDYINHHLDLNSRKTLSEYLAHAQAIKKERERAKKLREQPNFIKLLRDWGGVTIVYRRSLQESPAYINNHDELKKALEEGIFYLEGLEPIAVDLDEQGHTEALICRKRVKNQDNEWVSTTEEIKLPARALLVATGTQPNTAYEFEHKHTFNRLNLQYQHYEEEEGELKSAHGARHCKEKDFGPFTSYRKDQHRVSLIGDTHPVFHGSVVKAIASGMRTYPKIMKILQDKSANSAEEDYQKFAEQMNFLFNAKIIGIQRKTNKLLELVIQAPLAAKHFKPGQFYRLQNFETLSTQVEETLLQMEPIALVAAEREKSNGKLTFLVKEHNATTKLCATLKAGDPVSLMGPTGVRAKIPTEHETVLIMGNQDSFAFMRSYGTALRMAGNRVIYLCQLDTENDLYDQDQLENAADIIIWCINNSKTSFNKRSQDFVIFSHDLIKALVTYGQQEAKSISLSDVDRIYIVGNTEVLRRFQKTRQTLLKNHLIKGPKIFASVYGNMQCMLKGVCAQCLQWQIDPETGKRTKAVFVCSWQDQPLEIIDIDHIDERQAQNYLHDQLSNLWIDYLLTKHNIARV